MADFSSHRCLVEVTANTNTPPLLSTRRYSGMQTGANRLVTTWQEWSLTGSSNTLATPYCTRSSSSLPDLAAAATANLEMSSPSSAKSNPAARKLSARRLV